jgi:hypothetical protein
MDKEVFEKLIKAINSTKKYLGGVLYRPMGVPDKEPETVTEAKEQLLGLNSGIKKALMELESALKAMRKTEDNDGQPLIVQIAVAKEINQWEVLLDTITELVKSIEK